MKIPSSDDDKGIWLIAYLASTTIQTLGRSMHRGFIDEVYIKGIDEAAQKQADLILKRVKERTK